MEIPVNKQSAVLQHPCRDLSAPRALRPPHVKLILGLLLLLVFGRWVVPLDGRSFVLGDSGIYLYMGQQVNAGVKVYAEILENRTPLIFYLNAVGLLMLPGSPFGVLLLAYLFLLAFVLLCWKLLLRNLGLYPSLFASLLMLLTLPKLLLLPNLTESFSLPLQALSFLLLTYELSSGYRRRYPLIQGVLTALMFQFRPNHVGMALVYVLVCGWEVVGTHRWREGAAKISLFGTAFAICTAAFVLPFVLSGTLDQYLYGVFGYNLSYAADAGLFTRLRVLYFGFEQTAQFGLSIIALSVPIALLVLRPSWKLAENRFMICASLLVVVEGVLAAVSGKLYEHYFAMCLLPMAILAGVFAHWCYSAGSKSDAPPRLPRIAGRSACCLMALMSVTGSVRDLIDSSQRPAEATTAVVRFVRSAATPEDHVLVWGDKYRSIHYRLGLRSASRFFTTNFLYTERLYKKLAPAVLRDLQTAKPPLVIEMQQVDFPSLFSGYFGQSAEIQAWDDDGLRTLKRNLAAAYSVALIDSKSKIVVYRLSGPR